MPSLRTPGIWDNVFLQDSDNVPTLSSLVTQKKLSLEQAAVSPFAKVKNSWGLLKLDGASWAVV